MNVAVRGHGTCASQKR
jgi:hypothetical protein